MVSLSRAQRISLMYILWKLQRQQRLHEQQLIINKQFMRQFARSGGITEAQAIAAVEAEPTLDLTGVIPDSAYPNALLLSGLRAMTGNFDLASYKLLTTNLSLKEFDSEYFALRNRADSAYKSLRLNKLRSEGAVGLGCEPETGVAGSRTFLKMVCASGYYYPFHGEAERTQNYIWGFFRNTGAAHVNTGCAFAFQLLTTVQSRNAMILLTKYSDITDATRTSWVAIETVNNGASVQPFIIDGKEVTLLDLAGEGNAFVYVDANGKLIRGVNYPY